MKIVCDNCATKYSIADEKVSGKVFKIRCKKCSHVIVVKGTGEGEAAQAPAPEAAPEAPQPAAGVVWHLVIEREQVGPMSAEDVRARFSGGQIDAETYIWREGYGDWIKLSQSEEFRDLVAAAPSSEQATTRVSPDLFKGMPADEGPAPSENLFGGVAQVAPGVMTTNAQASTIVADGGAAAFAMGNMAGSAASNRSSRAPQASSSSVDERASSASASSASMSGMDVRPMTGARSENSVLFSLNNLQALAAGGAAGGGGGQAPVAQSSSGGRAGYANSQTEGSGLIDIRAMAAQTLAANNFSMGPSASKPDELPLAGNDAPLFAPVSPAMLLPTAAPQGMPKWVWALVGVGGLGVIALIAVVVITLTGQGQQPQPQPPVGAGNPPTGTGPAVAINAGQNPAGQKPSEVGTKPGEVGTKPTPAVKPSEVKGETPAADPGDRKGRKDRDRGDKSAKGRDTKSDRPDKDPTPTAPPPTRVDTPPPVEPKKPAKAKKPDDLDALLDSASSGSSGKPRAEAAKKDAPEQLSMDMIKSGLKSVSGSAQACGTPGTYMVKLTIGPSGRVSDASVPGKSGDAGADCVAKAVKGARFPEFTGSPQSITYPIIVR